MDSPGQSLFPEQPVTDLAVLQCQSGSTQSAKLFERGDYLIWSDFAQAIVMAETACSRQTWTARKSLIEDFRPWSEWPGPGRRGRAEDCDGRDAQRRRQMRRAGIIANEPVA